MSSCLRYDRIRALLVDCSSLTAHRCRIAVAVKGTKTRRTRTATRVRRMKERRTRNRFLAHAAAEKRPGEGHGVAASLCSLVVFTIYVSHKATMLTAQRAPGRVGGGEGDSGIGGEEDGVTIVQRRGVRTGSGTRGGRGGGGRSKEDEEPSEEDEERPESSRSTKRGR